MHKILAAARPHPFGIMQACVKGLSVKNADVGNGVMTAKPRIVGDNGLCTAVRKSQHQLCYQRTVPEKLHGAACKHGVKNLGIVVSPTIRNLNRKGVFALFHKDRDFGKDCVLHLLFVVGVGGIKKNVGTRAVDHNIMISNARYVQASFYRLLCNLEILAEAGGHALFDLGMRDPRGTRHIGQAIDKEILCFPALVAKNVTYLNAHDQHLPFGEWLARVFHALLVGFYPAAVPKQFILGHVGIYLVHDGVVFIDSEAAGLLLVVKRIGQDRP